MRRRRQTPRFIVVSGELHALIAIRRDVEVEVNRLRPCVGRELLEPQRVIQSDGTSDLGRYRFYERQMIPV